MRRRALDRRGIGWRQVWPSTRLAGPFASEGTLGRCVGFEPDYLLDHNQVLCRLSYHRHDRPTTDQSELLSPNRLHGHRGGAACTRNLKTGQFQHGGHSCQCTRRAGGSNSQELALRLFSRQFPSPSVGLALHVRRPARAARRCSGGTRTRDRRIMSAELHHLSYGASGTAMLHAARPCTRLFSSRTGFAAPATCPLHADGRRGIEPLTARTSLRRRDSNPRPPGYEPGGLPTCPTPRWSTWGRTSDLYCVEMLRFRCATGPFVEARKRSQPAPRWRTRLCTVPHSAPRIQPPATEAVGHRRSDELRAQGLAPVDRAGFEPATSALPERRATNCANSPNAPDRCESRYVGSAMSSRVRKASAFPCASSSGW